MPIESPTASHMRHWMSIAANVVLREGAYLDPTTCEMRIDFDPATVTGEDFGQMVEHVRSMYRHTLDWFVNGEKMPDGDAALRRMLALVAPRIEARKKRDAEKRDAWKASGYTKVAEMVPVWWLARLRGNERRRTDQEMDELRASIDAEGVREPVIIIVGKADRRAKIGEGNHRIEVAKALGLPELPARVLIWANVHGGGMYSYDVADDLLIPLPDQGWVPSDMRPSDVFRSLRAIRDGRPVQQ